MTDGGSSLDLRVELHVARHGHLLFPLVDLFDPLLKVGPYLLQVDVLQPRVAAECRSSHFDVLRLLSYVVLNL